ncbi:hypothetical protein GOHSU_47_00110 [Gordonia hirsuta DSM 44140 = NBRC 16056]|uniref:Uncharacterized protein n=1 Tax=Gordonia hirsuta DSM 44140 = NBRC 16056 TaxID=1121927 RepID=L7LC68_9ACTN|nr:hypothetical protein GOHSU_47_00110 [Gordonia hirsuta DSM 44140 = NBRC 16056]
MASSGAPQAAGTGALELACVDDEAEAAVALEAAKEPSDGSGVEEHAATSATVRARGPSREAVRADRTVRSVFCMGRMVAWSPWCETD